MPLVITVMSSERVRSGRNGRMVTGASVCAHENAGRDVERFRSAGAHHPGHDPGGKLNDELHDPEVIKKHREKRADENDGR